MQILKPSQLFQSIEKLLQFISKNTNQFILRNQIVILLNDIQSCNKKDKKNYQEVLKEIHKQPILLIQVLQLITLHISFLRREVLQQQSQPIHIELGEEKKLRNVRFLKYRNQLIMKTIILQRKSQSQRLYKEDSKQVWISQTKYQKKVFNCSFKVWFHFCNIGQKIQGLSLLKHSIPKNSLNCRLNIKQRNQLHQQYKQNEQMNRKKDTKKLLQNSQNILKKSKSQQRCKKRSITSITQKKQLTQRNSSSKTKNEITTQLTVYEGGLLEKYKQLQARYSKIYQNFFDESSCVQYLTDTDPNLMPSQPTSNKQQQVLIEEFILNRDEINYLKEFGILENELNRMHSAATKIQKVWRGFITRKQIFDQQFEQYYYKKLEIFNDETFRSQFRFEKDNQSIQQGNEQTLNQITYQNNHNFNQDLESYKKEIQKQKNSPKISDKFVKYQKMKWQELLNYISQLQSQSQEKTINEILKDLKLFTQQCFQDCSLSRFQIKKLEIQVPQFSQESIVMSEIRQAMCSEKLIRQLLTTSKKIENEQIFEEQTFYNFASKKMDEIMNRSQIDDLIKMRQLIVQEKQKFQQQALTQKFEQKLISPKTFKEKYQTLEKWVNKQNEDFENNKIIFEKGWQGLYNTFIQTEKELKFLHQQKYLQYSQLSNSQQFINYSISAFSDSGYKKSIQELSNQNETILVNNQTDEFENNRLKTHTSTSQTPDEKIRNQQNSENYHETIEWNDEQLLTSLQNNQEKDSNINNFVKHTPQKSLEQAEIDYLHQEVQNEELIWLKYDEFKFYILMDISNLVFNELIEEFEYECIQKQF
ncbi:unnamed protein product [Paramecium primaurelia]|uniref:IQ calmodulin-binding motif protein n=1 Tax=Paramecium primaurelia TaxID=5886 RepID=A0A8S1KTS2_PARPR|nr:unnamed protein product [Paramecium primaurelia]